MTSEDSSTWFFRYCAPFTSQNPPTPVAQILTSAYSAYQDLCALLGLQPTATSSGLNL